MIPLHSSTSKATSKATSKPTSTRDYKKEYREYHGKPEQIKNRNQRNAARKKAGLEVGDPREVDHGKPISKGGTNHANNLNVVSRTFNRKKGDS